MLSFIQEMLGKLENKESIINEIFSAGDRLSEALRNAVIAKKDHEYNPDSAILLKRSIASALESLSSSLMHFSISAEDLCNAAKIGNLEILNRLLSISEAELLLIKLKDKPEYLVLVEAFKNTPRSAHLAVNTGDLDFIKLIISDKNINARDFFGNTPLFYAKNAETIDHLLTHKADPYIRNQEEQDVITYMRAWKRDLRLINYLKSRIGFSHKTLDEFFKKIEALTKKELSAAIKNDKKLLMIVGEVHHFFPIYQVEKMILKSGSELGINSLLLEFNQELVEKVLAAAADVSCAHACKLMRHARSKLAMSVEGIDKYYQQGFGKKDYAKELRDSGMQEEILKRNEHAIVFIGTAHLNGLLCVKESRITERNFIDKEKYHIVPINLLKLCPQRMTVGIDVRIPDNVIELGCKPDLAEITISEPSNVIEYWNPTREVFSSESMQQGSSRSVPDAIGGPSSASSDPIAVLSPAPTQPIVPTFIEARKPKRKAQSHDAAAQMQIRSRMRNKNLKCKSH